MQTKRSLCAVTLVACLFCAMPLGVAHATEAPGPGPASASNLFWPESLEFPEVEQGWLSFYYQDGHALTGQKKIDGHWYYFDPAKGGAMTCGFVSFPSQDKVVYYDEAGCMVYGQVEIDGKPYVFAEGSGALIEGEAQPSYSPIKSTSEVVATFAEQAAITNGWVRYWFEDAKPIYGQRQIAGGWYYFDKSTGGRMACGFVPIPTQNKIVYYGRDGRMVYGTHTINGEEYHFDPHSGAMIRSVATTVTGS